MVPIVSSEKGRFVSSQWTGKRNPVAPLKIDRQLPIRIPDGGKHPAE
jgi:hypothetical protein